LDEVTSAETPAKSSENKTSSGNNERKERRGP
jgi:hypothetical protein